MLFLLFIVHLLTEGWVPCPPYRFYRFMNNTFLVTNFVVLSNNREKVLCKFFCTYFYISMKSFCPFEILVQYIYLTSKVSPLVCMYEK